MNRKPELLNLHMDITVKCNLFCKHCFYGEYNHERYIDKELNLEKYYNLIDEAVSMGCQKIILSGGEVLTSNKFKPLIKYCYEKSLKTIFITNGILLDDEVLEFICKYRENIEEIKVSYEGKGHDLIRGNGSSKKH